MSQLPDLGTYYAAHIKTKSGAPIFLLNCQAGAVFADVPGETNIAFTIQLDEKFIGNLIVRDHPDKIIAKLASWGNNFHAKCQLVPDRRYTTDDGQEVMPFYGEIFQDAHGVKRAA